MTTPSPTRVGRYQIVRQIGRSMTDVYLAIDTVGNRKTALKLVRAGGDAHSRLVMEAERRGAAIQRDLLGIDPRVVEVYETGDADGYFFVAMQYVEGRDLGAILHAEHTIDSIRAAAIALEVCEQLTKFHTWRSAVVHGDIKPSNIHLGPNDTVRLLDFGIAKTLRADCDATMVHFGSPSYCSPERLARSEIDEQSDLWAVGATLYQMLSGAPPYQAESTRKLESLIRSKRPPRALPANCPTRLRAIAMKALAPEAERRYRSAHDFQADLQAFLENKPVRAELERRQGWNAGATIARIRKVTHTVVQFHRHIQVVSGVSWFLLGMALWIGGTLAWRVTHVPRLTLELPAITAPKAPAKLDKLPGIEVDAPPPPPAPAPAHRKAKPRRYRVWR
jgi:serine/threonine protein kinase